MATRHTIYDTGIVGHIGAYLAAVEMEASGSRSKGGFQKGRTFAVSSAQRSLLILCLVGLSCTAYGQNILTIAGVPPGHRKAVDGQPALVAPLNSVYGLLFDNVTGRLLFHDVTMVERVEPD